jgi:hypothetical protein
LHGLEAKAADAIRDKATNGSSPLIEHRPQEVIQ